MGIRFALDSALLRRQHNMHFCCSLRARIRFHGAATRAKMAVKARAAWWTKADKQYRVIMALALAGTLNVRTYG